jgi:hypothetical protein
MPPLPGWREVQPPNLDAAVRATLGGGELFGRGAGDIAKMFQDWRKTQQQDRSAAMIPTLAGVNDGSSAAAAIAAVAAGINPRDMTPELQAALLGTHQRGADVDSRTAAAEASRASADATRAASARASAAAAATNARNAELARHTGPLATMLANSTLDPAARALLAADGNFSVPPVDARPGVVDANRGYTEAATSAGSDIDAAMTRQASERASAETAVERDQSTVAAVPQSARDALAFARSLEGTSLTPQDILTIFGQTLASAQGNENTRTARDEELRARAQEAERARALLEEYREILNPYSGGGSQGSALGSVGAMGLPDITDISGLSGPTNENQELLMAAQRAEVNPTLVNQIMRRDGVDLETAIVTAQEVTRQQAQQTQSGGQALPRPLQGFADTIADDEFITTGDVETVFRNWRGHRREERGDDLAHIGATETLAGLDRQREAQTWVRQDPITRRMASDPEGLIRELRQSNLPTEVVEARIAAIRQDMAAYSDTFTGSAPMSWGPEGDAAEDQFAALSTTFQLLDQRQRVLDILNNAGNIDPVSVLRDLNGGELGEDNGIDTSQWADVIPVVAERTGLSEGQVAALAAHFINNGDGLFRSGDLTTNSRRLTDMIRRTVGDASTISEVQAGTSRVRRLMRQQEQIRAEGQMAADTIRRLERLGASDSELAPYREELSRLRDDYIAMGETAERLALELAPSRTPPRSMEKTPPDRAPEVERVVTDHLQRILEERGDTGEEGSLEQGATPWADRHSGERPEHVVLLAQQEIMTNPNLPPDARNWYRSLRAQQMMRDNPAFMEAAVADPIGVWRQMLQIRQDAR